jgi:hypothetical protein
MSQEPSGRRAKGFVRPLPSNPNLDKQRKLAKARSPATIGATNLQRSSAFVRCIRSPRLPLPYCDGGPATGYCHATCKATSLDGERGRS